MTRERGKRDYLNDQEQQAVEDGFRLGRKPASLAAELKVSVRSINRRFEKLRNGPAQRRPKSPCRVIKQTPKPEPQTEAERKASRFYRSTFEL